MPFDPRISLAVDTPKTVSFADLARGRLAAENAIAQRDSMRANQDLTKIRIDQEKLDNDILRKKLKQAEEDDADDEIYHEAMAKAGPEADWQKVRSDLATKVKPRNLTRYDAETAKAVQSWNAMNAEKRKAALDTNKAIGDSLIGISILPESDRQLAWTSEKARLEQEGVIKPGSVPDVVPDENGLKSMIAKHGAYTNYLGTVQKQAAAGLAAQKTKTEEEKAARAEINDINQELWQNLAGMGKDLDEAKYQEIISKDRFKKIREDLPTTLANAKTGRTAQETIENIRRRALSAEKAGVEADKAVDNARLAEENAAQDRSRRIRDNAAMIRANTARGGTAKTPSASELKEWRADLRKTEDEESAIRDVRRAIEVALTTGGSYVGKDGKQIPMAKALGQASDATKQSLIADMQTRYEKLGGDLRRAVHDKYLAGETLQIKGTTPKEKVLAAIDEDDARVLKGQQKQTEAAPAGGTPPAAAAPAKPVAKPAATPEIDPAIKEKGGFKVDQQYKTKDGRTFILKGFTKDGKAIPEYLNGK